MTRSRTFADWRLAVFVAADQLMNALAFGDAHATISSRAYIATLKKKRWACVLCRVLDRIQQDHCLISWQRELVLDQARISSEGVCKPVT